MTAPDTAAPQGPETTEALPAATTGAPAAAPAGTPVLQVRDVSVELGGRLVLHDVDLAVATGEFVGLIGPNGAGKTTLLRSILTLIKRRGGTITVDGRPARTGHPSLGYVPQRHEFAWDFPISVEEVVMTGRVGVMGWLRRPGVEDHRAVNDALAQVRMDHLRDRVVGELSGGQRQRVLVARALSLRPSLLLLDEPYTGLDMPTQELLTDLFTELSAAGRAVVMTTHDLVAAKHSCTRLCLLNRTVIADGTPAELSEPGPWMETFQVGPRSPLLHSLGMPAS